MLDLNKYKVDLKCPDTSINRPTLPVNATPDEIRKYAGKLMEYAEIIEDAARAAEGYRKACADALQQFKVDVLAEHGLTNHPKAEKLYALAYDAGKAFGLGDVADWVADLAPLVKD